MPTRNLNTNLKITSSIELEGILYDGNSSAGTSGQVLSSTSTGTDWVTLSEISGVDGSGTANYLSKWLDANTITNSLVYDNGTNVGIGTTSPAEKLHVIGNARLEQTSNADAVLSLHANSATIGSAYEWNLVGGNSASSYAFQIRQDVTPYLTIRNSAGGSGGNVGIGTASPADKLHVSAGAIRLDNFYQLRWGGTGTGIYGHSSQGLNFYTNNGATRIKVENGGNVGIGTTSPKGKLHVLDGTAASYTPDSEGDTVVIESSVVGGISLIGTGSGSAQKQKLVFGTTGNTAGASVMYDPNNSFMSVGTTATSNFLKFLTGNGTEAMRLAANGNVGIGITNPNQGVLIANAYDAVDQGDNTCQLKVHHNVTTTGAASGIAFGVSGSKTIIGAKIAHLRTSSNSVGGLLFYTRSDTASTDDLTVERMRIDKDGNVGIGTTSPAGVLDVDGQYGDLKIGDPSVGSRITYYDTTRILLNSSDIRFYTSSLTERMRINSSGNVGIGTPSPTTALQIGGYGGTNSISFFNANQYIRADSGTNIEFGSSYGFQFTAGNSASSYFTGGNVGIGTTSPLTQLHVNNSVYGSNTNGISIGKIEASGWTDTNEELGRLSWYGSYSNSYTAGVGAYISAAADANWNDTETPSRLTFSTAPESSTTPVERLRIDKDGNVGIGTTSPDSLLHVEGTNPVVTVMPTGNSGLASVQFYRTTGAGTEIASGKIGSTAGTQSGLEISTSDTSNSPHIKIESAGHLLLQSASGNVGIGTTDPEGHLQIWRDNTTVNGEANRDFYIRNDSSVGDAMIGLATSASSFGLGIDSSNTSFNISEHNNDLATQPRLVIKAGGNVGIGTTSPGRPLTINSDTSHRAIRILENDSANESWDIGVDVDGDLNFFNSADTNPTVIFSDIGNVGIGILAPTFKLHVKSDDSNDDIAYIHHDNPSQSSGTVLKVRSDAGDSSGYSLLDISNNTGNALYVRGDRRVGIGTTSPGAKLDIHTATNTNGLLIREDTDDTITHNFYIDSSDNGVGVLYANGQSSKILLNTAGNSYFNGGNVGIGTTSPSTALDVAGAGKFTGQVTIPATPSASTDAASKGYVDAQVGSADTLQEVTDNGATTTNSIGIGTTSPSRQLDVNGAIRFSSISNQAVNGFGEIYTSYAYGKGQIFIAPEAVSTPASFHPNGGVIIGTTSVSPPSNGLIVSGNVGIGTTNPSRKLVVAGNVGLTGSNTYIFGGDDEILAGQDGSGYYFATGNGQNVNKPVNIGDNNSYIRFKSGDSERMRITSAGNVGIGTNNPSHKLQIGLTSSVSLANQPAEPLHVSNNGNSVDGRVFISVKHDVINTAAAPGAGLKMTAGAVTSGTASYFDSLIYLESAGPGSDTIHSAPKAIKFYVDNHATNAGSGTNYGDLGDLALTISEDAKVGIGTTSTDTLHGVSYGTTKLHIDGGTSRGQMILEGDQLAAIIFSDNGHTANQRVFSTMVNNGDYQIKPLSDNGTSTAGGPAITVLHGGNVGIGTTSPTNKLDVFGNILISDTANDKYFGSNVNLILNADADGNSGDAYRNIIFQNRGSETARIDVSGNVGIGTTSPSSKLHVDGLISSDQIQSKEYTSLTGNTNDWFPIGSIDENNTGPVLFQVITAYHSNMSFIVGDGYSGSARGNITLLNSVNNANTSYANIAAARVKDDGVVEIKLQWSTGPTVSVKITARSTTSPVTLPSSLATATSTSTVRDTVTNETGKLRSKNLITTDSNVVLNNSGISYLNGGNVGIGTNSPAVNLHVESSTSAQFKVGNGTQFVRLYADADEATILADGSVDMRFYTAGAEKMRIDTGGNVGIGTTSPATKLHVVGRARFDDTQINAKGVFADYFSSGQSLTLNSGASASILFKIGNTTALTLDSSENATFTGDIKSIGTIGVTQSDGDYLAKLYQSSADGFLELFTGQATPVSRTKITSYGNSYINPSNGNVGIGTTSPSTKLQVAGTSQFDGNLNVANSTLSITAAAPNMLFVVPSGGLDSRIYNDGSGNFIIGHGTNSNTPTERLRINSSGNVGIGTTSPSTALDVAGAGKFTGQVTIPATPSASTDAASKGYVDAQVGSADTLQEVTDNGATTTNSIGIGTTSPSKKLDVHAGTTSDIVKFQNNNGAIVIGKTANLGSLDMASDASFRVRHGSTVSAYFKSNGNVGIGTNNPSVGLQLGNSVSGQTKTAIFNSEGGAEVGLTIKSRTNRAKLAVSDNDTTAYMVAEGSIASFGRADTAASTNISVLTNGNVGIGTTSPSAPLDISSSATGGTTIELDNTSTGGRNWTLYSSGSGNSFGAGKFVLYDADAASVRMLIDTSGNVGIGPLVNGIPLYPLDIIKPSNTNSDTIINLRANWANTSADKKIGSVLFTAYDADVNAGAYYETAKIGARAANEWTSSSNVNADIFFETIDSGNLASRMVIKHDGNVGIGTNAPDDLLHAYHGNIRITAAGTTAAVLSLHPNNGNSVDKWQIVAAADGSNLSFDNKSAGSMVSTMALTDDGNVGIGTTSPSALLDVATTSSTNVKVTKIANDTTTVYRYATLADAVLEWTCGSYHNAEVVITASQTNTGTYNNLYIRGIWSNNHTSHHWDELEHVGSLTGTTFTITNGQNGSTTNSGRLTLDVDYVSGSFATLNIRITDFFGSHSYTIT